MTAARWPSRAAPTATFVGLPPSDFANVRTSASDTPICSGYRSTLTRPSVMTSYLAMRPREVAAARDLPRRIDVAGGCCRERDVLLEYVPPVVAAVAQRAQNVGDPCVAVAERPEQSERDRLRIRHASLAHGRREVGVGILEV